jgi:hypothetical protein
MLQEVISFPPSHQIHACPHKLGNHQSQALLAVQTRPVPLVLGEQSASKRWGWNASPRPVPHESRPCRPQPRCRPSGGCAFEGLWSVCGPLPLACVLWSQAHKRHRVGVEQQVTQGRRAALEGAATWRVASTSKTRSRRAFRSHTPPMVSDVHPSANPCVWKSARNASKQG